MIATLILQATLIYLPTMIANAMPVFVGIGTPIDGGRVFIDGRRVLGDGKTWEGFILGLSFGYCVGCIEAFILHSFPYILIGFLGSLGALLGDIVGSFIKRRFGYRRGYPLIPLDQTDFTIGATIMLLVGGMDIEFTVFLIGLIMLFVLHLISNRIAFMLGLKSVPW